MIARFSPKVCEKSDVRNPKTILAIKQPWKKSCLSVLLKKYSLKSHITKRLVHSRSDVLQLSGHYFLLSTKPDVNLKRRHQIYYSSLSLDYVYKNKIYIHEM